MPVLRRLIAAASLVLAGLLQAQTTAGTGAITGRVFNPATGEYVRLAEILVAGTPLTAVSGEGGEFTLGNLPPGEVTLHLHYTGYQAAPARVVVEAGRTAQLDFNLVSTDLKPAT